MISILMTGLILQVAALAAPTTQPAGQAGDLRVMTFNIRFGTANDGENRWERRREILFEVIRKHSPDVLGLQEALRFQLEEIRKAVPGYGQIGVGRDDGKQAGEYSAILYRQDRLRPVESGTFWFSDTPEKPGSMTWGNRLPRICTWARFEDRSTGSTFYHYNLHIDHESQPSRERSVELLARRIAERKMPDVPVIVTGDFNSDERNPAIRYLVAGSNGGRATTRFATPAPVHLVDTFRALHPDAKNVCTASGFKGITTGPKIDYILVLPGTQVPEAEILHDNLNGRYPSDHFPVLAVVGLKPSR